MAIKQLVAVITITALLTPSALTASTVHADTTSEPIIAESSLLIHEIKLGGDSYSQGPDQKDPKEYITIINQGSTTVDLSAITVEYAKSSFDPTYCASDRWLPHSVNGSAAEIKLSGILLPGELSKPILRTLTDNAPGSVRITETLEEAVKIHDLVGWGDVAACKESAPTTIPANGKSIVRYAECDAGAYIDTAMNLDDFAANQLPTPFVKSNLVHPDCTEDVPEIIPDIEPPIIEVPPPSISCDGVIINELLPNPGGADTDKEFIELYNPTDDFISPNGCSLKIHSSGKVHVFMDSPDMAPRGFMTIHTKNIGFVLPNAAGTTLDLLNAEAAVIDSVSYPGGLEDDVSWARFSEEFSATYTPTPGLQNILLSAKPCTHGYQRLNESEVCTKTPAAAPSLTLVECKQGQERNPITNRCRNVVQLANLSPCKEGQERNPETNRCKAVIAVSAASLTPCKAGQERNPETNRCKNVLASTTTLKPCAEGQERNPETNRCRKASAASASSGLAQVKDVPSQVIAKSFRWVAVGVAAFAAISYGIYEWRHDISNALVRFRDKLKTFKSKD